MNTKRWLILGFALAMIAGTGASLAYMRTHQRLGQPGVKSTPIAGSPRLELFLPERVLDYSSVLIPTETNLLNGLPHDTSFIQRLYLEPHETVTNWLQARIVMMGTDRTSIHKPELCLTGVGFNIKQQDYETIHIAGDRPYDLQVRKLMATQETTINGHPVVRRGIYYYWFVAENELTASHGTRMWKTAAHLMKTGELQRWAYVSCFMICPPGAEEAACERIRKFIATAVPEFQVTSGAGKTTAGESRPPARAGAG